jgi:putative tryptophan/tyrosine transport system substrate-binding protein
MQRREFITIVGGAAAASPLTTKAQRRDRMKRPGVLMGQAANDAEAPVRIASFLTGLQQETG